MRKNKTHENFFVTGFDTCTGICLSIAPKSMKYVNELFYIVILRSVINCFCHQKTKSHKCNEL